MKKAELRAAVEAKLAEVGFAGHLWFWLDHPNELELLVGSEKRNIEFRSGMSKRKLAHELGVIEGWANRSRPSRRPLPKGPKPKPMKDHQYGLFDGAQAA